MTESFPGNKPKDVSRSGEFADSYLKKLAEVKAEKDDALRRAEEKKSEFEKSTNEAEKSILYREWKAAEKEAREADFEYQQIQIDEGAGKNLKKAA